MLRIAIANDSAIATEALRRAIMTLSDYQLLWVARTGAEAIERCVAQRPDLILMDMHMPDLDGVEATRQIMQKTPCAILIVTATITGNTAKIFEAMGYGALDVVKTPYLGIDNPQAMQPLLRKIAIVAKLSRSDPHRLATTPNAQPSPLPAPSANPQLIVIGASTGGPNALQHILSRLPRRFNAAIIVIQHIDEQFAPGLVNWLNQSSQLPVALACNGDRPTAGKVLIAGINNHLILRPNQTLRYRREPADYFYRPSVDVFFQSVAQHWGQPGTAILLTGMGRDGAVGMAQLHATGWYTIAESAESCVVFGMPRAAIELKAARAVLPLNQIASKIVKAPTSSILSY